MSVGLIVLLAMLSTMSVTALRDGYADDNCWLLLIRETGTLEGFLAHSFGTMHREGPGVIFYALLSQFEHPWFPWLWHGINILTEVGSPVILYLCVKRYTSESLAVLAGVALIALHGDHTAGYISGINYRIGLLFTLLSFWLMARYYWTAVLCAVLAMWGCTETAVALEPMRLLLLSPVACLPFLLSAGSLVAARLMIPIEGMWAGAYAPPESFYEISRLILLWPYKEAQDISGALQIADPWTCLYGLLGGCTAWVLACYLRESDASSASA